jgi:hypothetical protein
MNEYYTYAYLREDGTPYYIGKGIGRRINKPHGYVPVPPSNRRIFLKQNMTESDALRHERYIISIVGRKNIGTGPLINITEGGENGGGGWNKGMTMNFSPDRGDKISQSLKGYKKTTEHLTNISNSRMGIEPWNKGKSRFKSKEEKIQHKREYNRLRNARIRQEQNYSPSKVHNNTETNIDD